MKTSLWAVRRSVLLILLGAAVASAVSCADRGWLVEPKSDLPQVATPGRPAQNGVLVLGARGPVPGRRVLSLSFGDKTTAKDSVWWPDTFPVATRIKMTVHGRISRNYNPDIWLSLNLAGKPYFAIDADGEFISFACYGQIVTDFRTAPNGGGLNVNGCRTGTYTNPNFPIQDGTIEHSTTGVAKGYGYVRRLAFGQPSYPATQYCGVWPTARCVWANPGSQDITIEPTATLLTLTATPDSILSGDQVLFQPAVNGLPYTVKSWIWVPDDSDTFVSVPPVASRAAESSLSTVATPRPPLSDRISPSTASMVKPSGQRSKSASESFASPGTPSAILDPRTVYCPTTGSNCQIPIYQSGTMYVRAVVGSGSSAVLEQASAHVRVADPKLIANCDQNAGYSTIRIYEVQCTAELSDKSLPFTITLRRAVTVDTVIEESNLSVPILAGDQDYWEGGRAVATTVSFRATVNILNRTLPLISNDAPFVVTPRVWTEPSRPTVAPIEWITEAVAFANSKSLSPDTTVPGPYPGFVISKRSGVRDSIIRGGVANYRFGGPSFVQSRISQGPNKDYVYLVSMPEINMGIVRVLNSLQEGSAFFGAQSSATKLPNEKNPPAPYTQYCDSAAMVAWRTLVFAHEGAATGAAASHHSATMAYVAAHPLKAFFEPLVYYQPGNGPMETELTRRWTTMYAIPASKANAHTNEGGPVPGVSAVPCKLRS